MSHKYKRVSYYLGFYSLQTLSVLAVIFEQPTEMRFTTAVSTSIAVLFSIAVANAAIMVRDSDTVADGPGEGDSAPAPPVEPFAHEASTCKACSSLRRH